MSSPVHSPTPSVLRRDSKRVEYTTTLLYRLGGEDNLELTILNFEDRIMKDPMLQPFFANTSMAMFRAHQKIFMDAAFTEIPKDFDVAAFIIERHHRLFEMGLNETHFDRVAGHLVQALKQMWVEQDVVDDVVRLLGPFRSIFEKSGRSDKIMGVMYNRIKEKREAKAPQRKKREEEREARRKEREKRRSSENATIEEPHRKGAGRIRSGEERPLSMRKAVGKTLSGEGLLSMRKAVGRTLSRDWLRSPPIFRVNGSMRSKGASH